MRLFLYEYACAQPDSTDLPDSVRREGRAMFDAVMEDARLLAPAIEIVTISHTQHSGLSSQDSFLATARQADHALIIAPEFDGILEERARCVLEAGCQLLGPLPKAIRLTADKWELYRHWKRRGVATPRAWLGDALPTTPGKYLMKHRYGAGSLGVAWWKPGRQLPIDHLVQDYVGGMPVSIALLISLDGTITPLLPALQQMNERFEYQGGSFLDDDQPGHRLVQLARAAVNGISGLQGYVGVDAILGKAADGAEDVVLEINPRITTSYLGLRQATTANLMKLMLDVQLGLEIVPISWESQGISWNNRGKS